MRSRVASASPWISAVVSGVAFAIFWCGYDLAIDHRSLRHAVVEAAILVPLWTLYMRLVNRGETKRITQALDGLDKRGRVQVLEGARTGVPPADVNLRDRAVWLLERRIATHQRQRGVSLLILGLFLLLAIGLAVASNPWWTAGALVFAGVFVWALRYPSLQYRRLATLTDAPLQGSLPTS